MMIVAHLQELEQVIAAARKRGCGQDRRVS